MIKVTSSVLVSKTSLVDNDFPVIRNPPAVPIVVVIAGGVGARHGLIFKSPESIETARKISHVIFGKTGTITDGKLSVVEEEYMDDSVASVILGIVTNSKHPVSIAIADHLKAKNIKAICLENVKSIPENRLEAIWNQATVRAGNPHWLNVQDLSSISNIISKALTTFCHTQRQTYRSLRSP
ncbi:hypothetical protein G7Y89_g6623 [Cudoniella acicularis]|uniref:Uncharacterized protein n=1 Tax=Cudoniella acicularis TaxID=354080 RepID=A0A8H4RKX6_9HELO|nr:hypothetical protein G7Y89_g6623 [Cudoniella acicularis]